MSGFKEERIDGCFFRATYSGKGGAYDLTAHYSLLMRRNDRAESPMRLCTTPSVLKYTPEYLSFQRFQRVTTQIFVFLEIQMDYYIRMYIDIFQSVDSLILLRMQSLVEISRKTNRIFRNEGVQFCAWHMDPDDEEGSGNAINLPSFVYIIDVLYK